jgi:hypothetical protein
MFIKNRLQEVLLLVIMLSSISLVRSQEKLTLNGYIRDASSGEELIGVTAYIKEREGGVASNHYGFYSITLAPGEYTVVCSYVALKVVAKTGNLQSDRCQLKY